MDPLTVHDDRDWYKMCAFLMLKQGVTQVSISLEELMSYAVRGPMAITATFTEKTIELKLGTESDVSPRPVQ
jgi:hypothetical protein